MQNEKKQGFDAIVFAPNSSKLREGLINAILYGGHGLTRNPRHLMAEMPVIDETGKTWEMTADTKSFRVVDAELVNDDIKHFGDKVLVVQFQRSSHSLKLSGFGDYSVATVSSALAPGHLARLANQIVADLVVNGNMPAPKTAERRRSRRRREYDGSLKDFLLQRAT